ncbi:hypothetical protein IEQ34_002784 [Dendrobium chrysotoxum]|uniref:Uncharacterized protein n=1 Tax=Dendrobium chrysotoxum TaxID=161865 RepID=A0AAV7HGQ1_DENCH|nr:hypothetical protein IEQ34_002784 [Dendrobium chrysotoxum]
MNEDHPKTPPSEENPPKGEAKNTNQSDRKHPKSHHISPTCAEQAPEPEPVSISSDVEYHSLARFLMHKEKMGGHESSTIAAILPRSTYLRMRLPIRLNGVLLRTLITLPFLLPMLPAEMLLNTSEVSKRTGGIMVNAGDFRAYVDLLPHLLARSLLQFPWQIMPSSVKLKILISLEAFVADLTDEPICRHKTRWR